MAGSSGNWFGAKGKGASAKGKVFISNKAIAKYAGVSPSNTAAIGAAKQWLHTAATTETSVIQDYLAALAQVSVQPKGMAKATPKESPPEAAAPPPTKGKPAKVNKFNDKMKGLGLPTLAASPKTTKGTITVPMGFAKEPAEATGDVYPGGLMVNKDPKSGLWNITHMGTGMTLMGGGGNKGEAQAVAESLLATGVDWTLGKDDLIATGFPSTATWKAIKSAWDDGSLLEKQSAGAQGVIDSLSYQLKDAAAGPAYAKAAKAAAKAKAAAAKLAEIAKKQSLKPPTKRELADAAKALSSAQKSRNGGAIDTAERAMRSLFRRITQKIALSPEQNSAMAYYQGNGYDNVNGLLWGASRDPVTGAIAYGGKSLSATVQSLMDASKLFGAPFDMISYRSANASHPLTAWAASVSPGDLYVNKGFDSTSFSPDFDPVKGGGNAATRLVFNIPKGARGIYFNGTSGYTDKDTGYTTEKEWLVPANSKWRVSGVSMQNGVKVVKVDLIGQGDLDGNAIWP